jgi:hypothetical protein
MRCFWTRLVAVLASSLLVTAIAAQAQDAWIGTWKLNVSKSKFSPEPPGGVKSGMLKIEPVAGGSQRHTIDMVDSAGRTRHTERVAKFDGAEVPVNGTGTPAPPTPATNSFRKLNDHSFEVTIKADGKVVETVQVVVAADGKTMTQTETGTTQEGQKFTGVSVWEKQ